MYVWTCSFDRPNPQSALKGSLARCQCALTASWTELNGRHCMCCVCAVDALRVAAVCQARAVQADAACEDLEVEAGGESVAPEELALGMFWGCSIWFC